MLIINVEWWILKLRSCVRVGRDIREYTCLADESSQQFSLVFEKRLIKAAVRALREKRKEEEC